MAYKLYHKDADYSYVLGPFPAFECLKWRPDLLLAAYYDPAFREIDKFCKLAEKSGIKAETAPKLINKLAHGQKEPYVAVIYRKDGFFRSLSPAADHIVLHSVANSGNLGTILRSALAFNFADIALIGNCVSSFLPEIAKASMGAMFALNIEYFPTMSDYLRRYCASENKRQLFSFCLSPTAVNLSAIAAQFKQDEPRSLIFGNEGQGLAPEFEREPYTPVIIEQSPAVDSLNLAIAASIAMYNVKKYPLNPAMTDQAGKIK